MYLFYVESPLWFRGLASRVGGGGSSVDCTVRGGTNHRALAVWKRVWGPTMLLITYFSRLYHYFLILSFAVFFMYYVFFWVFSRRLSTDIRRFGTLYRFHLLRQSLPAYEDGTDRGFRNVGYQQSDAGETPKKNIFQYHYLFIYELTPLKLSPNHSASDSFFPI
jgi:hypothetical protein